MDDICVLDGAVIPGGKMRARRHYQLSGGQVPNCLVALQRLGLRTAFVGKIGDDLNGTAILSDLVEEGVGIEELQIGRGLASQHAFIMVNATTAERTIVWRRPEALAIDGARIPAQAIAGARALHLDGQDEGGLAAARAAKEEGVVVSLDAEEVLGHTAELLQVCDLIVADAAFPEKLGLPADDKSALAAMARFGARFVAITAGNRGAIALADGRLLTCPALNVDSVDTTGAGDAFRAGILFGFLSQWPWERVLQAGCAVGGLSTRGYGGRASLPSASELHAVLDQPEVFRRTNLP
ncbi:MAG: hypothetical protein HYV63_13600 [Candidatus Schekmanbacteria bacterium]|nr:hypothetical protein [Candidatus Schekmanbacteria bacterium]